MANDGSSFQGKIGSTWRESTPWWPAPVSAPANAPNILFIVLDDVGFSDIACYGSEIATPHMDALAAGGLRYNNFHVTAMCSPTRACLLTGRNAHAAGMGIISEWAGGYPGYRGKLSKAAATIPEVLACHQYGSYATGKWHLLNIDEYGAAGPHDGWPLGRGFNRWFGFHGALADQWNPELFQDNRAILHDKPEGYHLSTDLVDHAIGDMRDHMASAPTRPFFQYLAFGACHWPHHVPRAFIDRYRGQYSAGWDAIRAQRFAKQQALGIVPPGTRLAPRNPGVLPWGQVDADIKIVNERLQETYAGFMEHTDAEIGRLVDFLTETQQLDNTIIVLLSDNGASPEGGATGAINARRNLVFEKETSAQAMARIDEIGGEKAFNHYATGWAQVSNTPLKWYKRGNHGGGVRAPLIVHWPRGIADRGQIRSQYHHVIDIAPTLYELLGISAPAVFKGIEQIPVHGVSMAYTFSQANAATRKDTQIFEMLGDRAIWQQGWKAVVRHSKGQDFAQDRWELYRLDADFSETEDLATQESEQLTRLVSLWSEEARKYHVLPLDDRETERLKDRPKGEPRERFELRPSEIRLDRHACPDISDRSFRIDVEYWAHESVITQGAILSYGSWFAGLVLYIAEGQLHYAYRYDEATIYKVSAALPHESGLVKVALQFERTGKLCGLARLYIAGREYSSIEIPHTWPVNVLTSGISCGREGTAPVSNDCPCPSIFTGSKLRVVMSLKSDPEASAVRGFKAAMKEQ